MDRKIALAGFCALVGCSLGDKSSEGSGVTQADGPTQSSGGGGGSSDTEPWEPPQCTSGEKAKTAETQGTRLIVDGVWTLTFDDEAKENGYVDCTYARAFQGEQTQALQYDCPECEVITAGDAVMSEGEDCYAQITSSDPSRPELWGISEGQTLYRATRHQFPMSELTDFSGKGDGEEIPLSWSSTYTFTKGGEMELAAQASLRFWTDPDLLLEDHWVPRTEPYACGWSCEDPGDLALDYDLSIGTVMPNFRLEDACGEMVELWDFYGSYVVIDSSQSDCGPCRSMAAGEESFLTGMRKEGVPIHVVTLMGNGLAEPHLTPDDDTIIDWVDDYEIEEPVLKDKGYAYALFPEFIEGFNGDSYGFPAWVVLNPKMELIHGNVGFSDWDTVAELVSEDWAATAE